MSKYKTCSRCKQTKSIEQFRKNHKNPDGLTYPCRDCLNHAYKEYRQRKPRVFTEDMRLKNNLRNASAEGKEKRRAYSAAYYQANKSKHNELRRRYLAKCPGLNAAYVNAYRIKKKGNSSFKVTINDLKKLRSQKCLYCPIQPAGTVDHLIPVSRGGNHSIGNLVPACRSCNSRKGGRFLMEWRIKRGDFTKSDKTT